MSDPENKIKLPFTHTFAFDGVIYRAQIEKGTNLRWVQKDGWADCQYIPKRVMKKALKEWRRLNPPYQGFQFQYPQITSRYNLLALGGWLREKMGAA